MQDLKYNDTRWDDAENYWEAQLGVPLGMTKAIRMAGEKSNNLQVSPAGAKGVYQFIPSSQEGYLKKYGVDAWSNDPNEQAHAAVLHIKESLAAAGGDPVQAARRYHGGNNKARWGAQNQAYADRIAQDVERYRTEAETAFSWRNGNVTLPDWGNTEATYSPKLSSTLDVSQLYANKAQAEMSALEAKQTTLQEHSVQQKQILQMYGLDAETNLARGQYMASLLKQKTDELLILEDGKTNKANQNPVNYALSKIAPQFFFAGEDDMIAQKQQEIQRTSALLKDVQTNAQLDLNLNKKDKELLSNAELDARKKEVLAAADLMTYQAKQKEMEFQQKLDFDNQRLSIMRAQLENKSEEQKAKAVYDATKNPIGKDGELQPVIAELYEKAAKFLNYADGKELAVIAKGSKELQGLLATENFDTPSFKLVEWKRVHRGGKTDPIWATAYANAFGFNGYAAMPGTPLSPTSQELVASAKRPEEKKALTQMENIATWKRSVELIYPDGKIHTEHQSDLRNEKGAIKVPYAGRDNPYNANFGMVVSAGKSENSSELVRKVAASPLIAATLDRYKDNAADTAKITDKQVDYVAMQLVKDNKLTLQEASEQLADYYQAAVQVNNTVHKFREIGLPEQLGYRVPVAETMTPLADTADASIDTWGARGDLRLLERIRGAIKGVPPSVVVKNTAKPGEQSLDKTRTEDVRRLIINQGIASMAQ